jgi:hypothetical protein
VGFFFLNGPTITRVSAETDGNIAIQIGMQIAAMIQVAKKEAAARLVTIGDAEIKALGRSSSLLDDT